MTPRTPTAAATKAVRTGTAVRPRPGSSAIRTPLANGGASPAAAIRSATTDARAGRDAAARTEDHLVARRATTKAITRTTSTTATTPSSSTAQSAWRPTVGSARRATPKGKSGDAAAGQDPGQQAAARGDDQPGHRRDGDELAAIAPQLVERLQVDADERHLAGEHDRDRDDAGQRRHPGADPQREGEDVDRVARSLRVDGEALGDEERVAEDALRRRDHLGYIGCAVVRAQPDAVAEHPDTIAVVRTERPTQHHQPA